VESIHAPDLRIRFFVFIFIEPIQKQNIAIQKNRIPCVKTASYGRPKTSDLTFTVLRRFFREKTTVKFHFSIKKNNLLTSSRLLKFFQTRVFGTKKYNFGFLIQPATQVADQKYQLSDRKSLPFVTNEPSGKLVLGWPLDHDFQDKKSQDSVSPERQIRFKIKFSNSIRLF
jgi:hypothetical protein